MENSDIKAEREKMYAHIKEAKDRLNELRAECKHEKTHGGDYSWRIGSTQLADICDFCGSVVEFK